ncbi:MAG: (Fe-S)-binding protein [Deltaproteobacteria bacterium]|nr:(Fe-S)-binding protein [Deltaproteobacteria bacterium]
MKDIKKLTETFKELEEQLITCMRCGMCQSVCPLYNETLSETDVARGKLAILKGVSEQFFENIEDVNKVINKCLLCGSCAANCPSGVKVTDIFIKARVALINYEGLSTAKKIIFRKVLSNPSFFNKLLSFFSKFQGVAIKKTKFDSSCFRINIGDRKRHFPKIAPTSFYDRMKKKNRKQISNNKKTGLKVGFYAGCILDKFFPDIAEKVVDILEYHGAAVTLLDKTGCCGIPAIASGDLETFIKLTTLNADLFEEYGCDYYVTACATCTSTIKKTWPLVLDDQNKEISEKVKIISEKTFDIHRFITEKLSVELPSNSGEKRGIVTYHDPCHLKKSLGIYKEPRDLIKQNPLYEFVESDKSDSCCGMGGSFNLNHYDISKKIGEKKFKNLIKTECQFIATGCPACMMQIRDVAAANKSNVKIKHSIEIYWESLNL